MPAPTVFGQAGFWLLVLFSLVLPAVLFGVLLRLEVVSRWAVLAFGLLLVLIAGVDVALLQSLAVAARLTPSVADDLVFVSELSTALYLLPAMIGGVGVNIVSHVLLRQLGHAEQRFEWEHKNG